MADGYADVDFNVGEGGFAEAGGFGGESVDARLDGGKDKCAGCVGLDCGFDLSFRVDDEEFGTGNDGTGRVVDSALDAGVLNLGREREGEQQSGEKNAGVSQHVNPLAGVSFGWADLLPGSGPS